MQETLSPSVHPQVPSVARMTLLCLALAVIATPARASASSLSPKDLQIFAKAAGFMEPAPSGTASVAIVYAAGNAASQQDATDIASAFGSGLKAGNATLQAKVVAAGDLKSSGPYVAVIPAAGAMSDVVASAARAGHMLCVTPDEAAVDAGTCVMAVKTSPKIEISVSKAGAESAGIKFQSAFLLMAHEH
jgi:hypothetical protein